METTFKQIQPVAICPQCTYRSLPFGGQLCDVCALIPHTRKLYELDIATKELWIKIPLVLCAGVILFLCLIAIFGVR